jgi:hypothetical protein
VRLTDPVFIEVEKGWRFGFNEHFAITGEGEVIDRMQDREVYEQILGIGSPWYVDRVELQLEKIPAAVRVYLKHRQQAWPCPELR